MIIYVEDEETIKKFHSANFNRERISIGDLEYIIENMEYTEKKDGTKMEIILRQIK